MIHISQSLSRVEDLIKVRENYDAIHAALRRARANGETNVIESAGRLMTMTVGGRNRNIDVDADLKIVLAYALLQAA
jgi:hypothetical protein